MEMKCDEINKFVWSRKNIGTYNTKVAKAIRWFGKFLYGSRISFHLRGRGKRKVLVDNHWEKFHQDLPIQYAKRVAVYVTLKKRR